MKKEIHIFVAGHKGMVGNAVVRILTANGYEKIITAEKQDLNLKDTKAVAEFFSEHRIQVVINCAAKVGGIVANDSYPYDFLMDNLQIQNNLIESSIQHKIQKFIFLGSSCIYPKFAPQPLKEEYLLTGSLEPTNQWYAIAKIAGILACQAARKQHGLNAISVMPTNLYGPNDNFNLTSSHVLPAMIHKLHNAKIEHLKSVTLWGTGTPFREFLHVDDLARAILFMLENEMEHDLVNVGFGSDVQIQELAQMVRSVVGFEGEIIWDTTKPDGTPRKWMDSSKMLHVGWKPEISLESGIESAYEWFLTNYSNLKV
jgi:GDP-L-fucose synthase